MYNFGSDIGSNITASDAATAGLFGGLAIAGAFLFILLIICIPIIVFYIVCLCKVYKKAGRKAWEAIIPFYSQWVYVEIAGLKWWWFLIYIASTITGFIGAKTLAPLGALASIFGYFVCNYNIAKKLKKPVSTAVLMTIFPVVLIPIIAFSKDFAFDNTVAVTPNGPFDSNKAEAKVEKKEETKEEK